MWNWKVLRLERSERNICAKDGQTWEMRAFHVQNQSLLKWWKRPRLNRIRTRAHGPVPFVISRSEEIESSVKDHRIEYSYRMPSATTPEYRTTGRSNSLYIVTYLKQADGLRATKVAISSYGWKGARRKQSPMEVVDNYTTKMTQ